MKRIIILLLALLPLVAGAQDITVNHDSHDIIYKTIIESEASYDDMLKYLLAYDVLDNMVMHGNMIAGDLTPEQIDYASAGYTRMKVPLYLSNGYFTCRVIFRFKEGRYMIEAMNMRFYDGGMGGTTSKLYDGYDAFAFDIAIDLAIKHIDTKTTFSIPSEDW